MSSIDELARRAIATPARNGATEMTKPTTNTTPVTLEELQSLYFAVRDRHVAERQQAEQELLDVRREAQLSGMRIAEAASVVVSSGGQDGRPLTGAREAARAADDSIIAAEARVLAIRERQAEEVDALLAPYVQAVRADADRAEQEYAEAQKRRLAAQRTQRWINEQIQSARRTRTDVAVKRNQLAATAAQEYAGPRRAVGV